MWHTKPVPNINDWEKCIYSVTELNNKSSSSVAMTATQFISNARYAVPSLDYNSTLNTLTL